LNMDGSEYFLFTDETNKEPSPKSKFFIYGGVFIPSDALAPLHNLVEEIRRQRGFQAGDTFKFAPYTRPPHVSVQNFREAKREVLEGCVKLGVTFAACLVLHEIAKGRKPEELIGWGANTVFAAFNEFLRMKASTGVVITDRLPFEQDFAYLRDKFQTGLTFPNGSTRRLDQILLFAASCEGASHAMSTIDIVLGAFRYCVNEHEKTVAPKKIMASVARMLWAKEWNGKLYFREYGLRFRPKTVKVADYEAEYERLIEHLRGLLD